MKRTDNGFEDREGHQAPFTLPLKTFCQRTCRQRENSKASLDQFEDGIRLGKLPRLQLGIKLSSVHADFKHTAARRDQFHRRDALLQCQNFLRQTDGARLVVSSRAILDSDFRIHQSITKSQRTEAEPLRQDDGTVFPDAFH